MVFIVNPYANKGEHFVAHHHMAIKQYLTTYIQYLIFVEKHDYMM